MRPDVDTQWPDVRIYAHLTTDDCTLYIDTSGEPLFKRGWREDKGEAPLKETLAAAMIAASGWDAARRRCTTPAAAAAPSPSRRRRSPATSRPGMLRRFGFEQLLPYPGRMCGRQLKEEAQAAAARRRRRRCSAATWPSAWSTSPQRNAERAGVADAVQLRGGDALQRMPPCETPGVMLLNPPYGERIEAAGVAGPRASGGRERAQTEDGGDFFTQLAAHWKKNYAGWTAWVLTPDLKLPSRMRLKESRRVPMWNGPIECRLFRFDMVAGSARANAMQAAGA